MARPVLALAHDGGGGGARPLLIPGLVSVRWSRAAGGTTGHEVSPQSTLTWAVQERRVLFTLSGVSRSERPENDDQGRGRLTPTSRFSSVRSSDRPVTSDTDLHAATPARFERVRPMFELRCADVHPCRCERTLRAPYAQDVVALACDHGAHVHGFTPVWYSPERLAVIAAAVTTRPG